MSCPLHRKKGLFSTVSAVIWASLFFVVDKWEFSAFDLAIMFLPLRKEIPTLEQRSPETSYILALLYKPWCWMLKIFALFKTNIFLIHCNYWTDYVARQMLSYLAAKV